MNIMQHHVLCELINTLNTCNEALHLVRVNECKQALYAVGFNKYNEALCTVLYSKLQ